MARSPTLDAPRLRLEPFGEQHLTERYVGWLNNPDVVRHSEQRHRKHTLESCRGYWRSFDGTPHYFWAIVARDPVLGHVGNLNAYVDLPNRTADLGILVGDRASWGRGLGTEAWTTACRFLLGPLGLRKVTAGTMAENRGMLGLARKAGMVEEGRRQGHFLLHGREVDLVLLSLSTPPSGPVPKAGEAP